ncbi:hypothetical protein LEMLEM_LOCUS201 [Lemmus lemmus]
MPSRSHQSGVAVSKAPSVCHEDLSRDEQLRKERALGLLWLHPIVCRPGWSEKGKDMVVCPSLFSDCAWDAGSSCILDVPALMNCELK